MPMHKKYREKRRADGLCPDCGNQTDRPGKTQCSSCATRATKRTMKKRKEREAAGLCKHCNRKAEFGTRCQEHWYKAQSSFSTGSIHNWASLKVLLEAQGFKCAYTGIELIPTVNANLDHITSKRDGGSDTIDNLQWVDARINRMKTDMSHDAFIAMCRLIIGRLPQVSEKLNHRIAA